MANAADPTLAPLPAILKAHLRGDDLPRLRASGPLGKMLAAHSADYGMHKLERAHAAIPDDPLNFQHDPVACATSAGWSSAVLENMTLRYTRKGKLLQLNHDP